MWRLMVFLSSGRGEKWFGLVRVGVFSGVFVRKSVSSCLAIAGKESSGVVCCRLRLMHG